MSAWLFIAAAAICITVLVGGATRLTDSGLSITRWQPVAGIVPPLDAAGWRAAFAEYQQTPQYAQVNSAMTLAGFKRIYWWEWSHRLAARLAGLVFLAPLIWFWMRGVLPRAIVPRLLLMAVLGAAQGLLGWIMVRTGLGDRVDVDPYALAAHLGLAVILLGLVLWTLMDLRPLRKSPPSVPRPQGLATGILALVFLQIVLGGLVAGTHGGLIYNTWPLMDGGLAPPGLNWSELAADPGALQFLHRLTAYALLAAVLAHWLGRKSGESRLAGALVLAVMAQGGLGIAVLVLPPADPVLALAHQAGALAVFVLAAVHAHRNARKSLGSAAAGGL